MITSKELVINFHMTEACNFGCKYCYAIWADHNNAAELHRHEGKVEELLKTLAEFFFAPNRLKNLLGYESVRINFAGGEPMMLGKRFLTALAVARGYGFKTSIITNAHFLSDDVLESISPELDMLGISFDTADFELAKLIGRVDRKNRWLKPKRLLKVTETYRRINPGGTLKLNTVVNSINWQEDLGELMRKIAPDKWKLLRVLPVHDHELTIRDEQYVAYVKRHHALRNLIVEEDNEAMLHSYLMINPEGKFYQNGEAGDGYLQSDPILGVGVAKALRQIPFDPEAFAMRYDPNAGSILA